MVICGQLFQVYLINVCREVYLVCDHCRVFVFDLQVWNMDKLRFDEQVWYMECLSRGKFYIQHL